MAQGSTSCFLRSILARRSSSWSRSRSAAARNTNKVVYQTPARFATDPKDSPEPVVNLTSPSDIRQRPLWAGQGLRASECARQPEPPRVAEPLVVAKAVSAL